MVCRILALLCTGRSPAGFWVLGFGSAILLRMAVDSCKQDLALLGLISTQLLVRLFCMLSTPFIRIQLLICLRYEAVSGPDFLKSPLECATDLAISSTKGHPCLLWLRTILAPKSDCLQDVPPVSQNTYVDTDKAEDASVAGDFQNGDATSAPEGAHRETADAASSAPHHGAISEAERKTSSARDSTDVNDHGAEPEMQSSAPAPETTFGGGRDALWSAFEKEQLVDISLEDGVRTRKNADDDSRSETSAEEPTLSEEEELQAIMEAMMSIQKKSQVGLDSGSPLS